MATVADEVARRAVPVSANVADPTGGLLPRRVRHAVYAVVAALLLGAVWLVAMRGSAILLDLSGMASMFCL